MNAQPQNRDYVEAKDRTPKKGWRNLYIALYDFTSSSSGRLLNEGTVFWGDTTFPSREDAIWALNNASPRHCTKTGHAEWLGAFEVKE